MRQTIELLSSRIIEMLRRLALVQLSFVLTRRTAKLRRGPAQRSRLQNERGNPQFLQIDVFATLLTINIQFAVWFPRLHSISMSANLSAHLSQTAG